MVEEVVDIKGKREENPGPSALEKNLERVQREIGFVIASRTAISGQIGLFGSDVFSTSSMSQSVSSRRSIPIFSVNRPNFASRKCRSKREAHTTQLQGLDVYGWKADHLSLRSAAVQSRLPCDKMTEREQEAFPRMANSRALTSLFVLYRNKILVLWHLDPLVELRVEDVLKEIPPANNGDERLITGVHAFLQRYGYINFGVFVVRSKMLCQASRKVVVIGAGVAGLAAARQLRFFGFEVKVLEARPRVGGRVMTYHHGKNLVELGAQTVMGITGNPIITLAKQLPVHVIPVSNNCPIYDHHGKIVDPRKDKCIKESFKKMLQTCSHIAHGLGIEEINGKKLSLGQCFDHILDQQELLIQERCLAYWRKYRELCLQMRAINEKVVIVEMSIDATMSELRKYSDLETATFDTINMDLSDIFSTDEDRYCNAITVKCLRQTLATAVKGFDDLTEERTELEQALTDFKRLKPTTVYMNNTDKRILDFHLTDLECAIGGSLYSIPLKEFRIQFKGPQVMVREGYGNLMNGLTKDLNVELESIVDKIEYNSSSVRITYAHRERDKSMTSHTIDADAVICTLPLGLLKRSVKSELADCVKFDPPLPEWKQRSIENLGYGSMNKIALMFEKPFWDTNSHTFGRLNESSRSRGEMFLFVSNGESPVLLCLLAGESASIGGQVKEETLVQRAMDVLGNIFGNACPKKPIAHVMTLWHRDRFARGCYSYFATNSTAEDYDTLAIPLKDPEGTPRVLFAGEHTNRTYPGTVHGAFLSGIREAAVIADHFIGSIYSQDGRNEPEQDPNGIHFHIKEEDNVENGSES
ncbi:flavin containing amine oxidoreductase domain-containing protein [Ditylenchus destructor]|uniref:Lysine-specific histone demethylase n=1 Tax=Ditylenchus destructor TaxID=166010 RepID=A0AAD4MYF5_9BILA|nr:flavin containing amine oxidoreductase domain-containing protein [Ditylenchus destructor]